MIELSTLIIQEEKEKVIQYDYGCLMVYLKPKQWQDILDKISTDDLYDNDKKEYGYETSPHCTVLYGFHMDHFDKAKMKKQMSEISPINLTLSKVSAFNQPDWDILKFDVDSPYLFKLNEFFTKTYPYTNEYEYHPHATIAYLKKGMAEKYIRVFNELKPMSFHATKLVFSGLSSDDKITVDVSNNKQRSEKSE